MINFSIFHLRLCFTLLVSVQLSNAAKIELSNPNNIFRLTATIDTLFTKEPNQNDFTQSLLARQKFLGLHTDWYTFSFYESDAPYTFFTFNRNRVEFDTFHSKTMTFRVKERNGQYHFRVVFSADTNILDDVYSYLSVWTGHGLMAFKMNIVKVESYVRLDHRQNPIIQTVDDLQPAMLYDQKVEKGNNSSAKIFKIAPSISAQTERKLPRLVFRTGAFRVARVDDKVALQLTGFTDCLYILHFKHSYRAEMFLDYTSVDGTNDHVALEIAADVRSYLHDGTLQPYTRAESEPQSSSGSGGGDPRTLSLANWSGKHTRGEQESSRNVRNRGDRN